ncbi:hypothetical protein [Streptomyces pactum]|uniref:Uncharacterized protein n=1 Tax=Streptomyces pactum TaxID=68249 RepID=A0A1S6JAH3_9ACTN|nr:hypothetical protein [Streptomyces pactum]AQS68754.1 hypothetical protein B1H29_19065 [Streptomyces pactum]
MTDITSASRAGTSAARTGWFLWRVFKQRRWFQYLQYQAVVSALLFHDDPDQPTPPRVNEAARRLCEILDTIAVPMEARGGLLNKWARWFREKITHGVRYPRHEGPARHTYYERLRDWAQAAARTEEGDAALDYARFPSGDDRARLFAARVVAKTSGLLLSHDLPDGMNRLRENMAAEIHQDRTWTQEAAAHRRLMVVARSAGAGLASTLLFDVGFSQELSGSLTMGGLAAASTAVAEVTSGGFGGLSEQMKAARRQTRAWLSTLSIWLLRYVTWSEEATGQRPGGDGPELHELVDIVNALRSEEAGLEPPGDIGLVKDHLDRLIEVANRVGDQDLETALMNLQTAVIYDPAEILNPLTALITMVDGVPDAPGPKPVARPARLPPARGFPHQHGQRDPLAEPELD